ncbi:M15 family metallopeptidase [Lacicoccus alkaliphilus]|uniref:M15 family metallopeptidase n=1 Tax=Lacicoccus alkaliphilus TaxID=148453 RepID=UPI0039EFBCD8
MEKAEEEDISIRITDGFRSHEEQDALFAQGRTAPGQIVTNARGGESYHNYGLAVDFAIEDGDDLVWDVEHDGNDSGTSDWEEVGEIAKDLGFEWGGDWDDFVDYPHLQMDFDTSLEELEKGDHDLF